MTQWCQAVLAASGRVAGLETDPGTPLGSRRPPTSHRGAGRRASARPWRWRASALRCRRRLRSAVPGRAASAHQRTTPETDRTRGRQGVLSRARPGERRAHADAEGRAPAALHGARAAGRTPARGLERAPAIRATCRASSGRQANWTRRGRSTGWSSRRASPGRRPRNRLRRPSRRRLKSCIPCRRATTSDSPTGSPSRSCPGKRTSRSAGGPTPAPRWPRSGARRLLRDAEPPIAMPSGSASRWIRRKRSRSIARCRRRSASSCSTARSSRLRPPRRPRDPAAR